MSARARDRVLNATELTARADLYLVSGLDQGMGLDDLLNFIEASYERLVVKLEAARREEQDT